MIILRTLCALLLLSWAAQTDVFAMEEEKRPKRSMSESDVPYEASKLSLEQFTSETNKKPVITSPFATKSKEDRRAIDGNKRSSSQNSDCSGSRNSGGKKTPTGSTRYVTNDDPDLEEIIRSVCLSLETKKIVEGLERNINCLPSNLEAQVDLILAQNLDQESVVTAIYAILFPLNQ